MEVSARNFKSHLSEFVQQTQDGQAIELTSLRKVVARLAGVPATDNTGLARRLAAGLISWQGGKPAGADLSLAAGGKSVAALVLADRA